MWRPPILRPPTGRVAAFSGLVLLSLLPGGCSIRQPIELAFDFGAGLDGWQAGFADYPVGEEDFYELSADSARLPPPLEHLRGFRVSGNNHSDDLFMFIKKRFTGFVPHTRYALHFEVQFATNAPSGCAGVGGAPGEGVTVKAGATAVEPVAEDDGTGTYRMNIDKGNQAVGGSDALVLGDFANSRDCESGDFSYELKTLDSGFQPFTVFSDAEGALWLLFGTDSGFESTSTIYYVRGRVKARAL